MRCEVRGARSEKCVSIVTRCARFVGVGRQAEFTTIPLCLLLLLLNSPTTQAFTFDDIDFWTGSGANRAAIVIDWIDNDTTQPALAWGYCWDGDAVGRDVLQAVVAADPRLFAKLGNLSTNPVRLYGFGYDADDDGNFGACRTIGEEIDCTEFDEAGFAYSGEIIVAATATDEGDLYREGWATGTGFWHYGISATPGTNPYDGGIWKDVDTFGIATRPLVDGDWDSWVFQFSTTPPFLSFAENPQAAASPYPPGDYDRDGVVTAADYDTWRNAFGSNAHAADGNRDGVVDAADYVVWRKHFVPESPLGAGSGSVPEPAAACLTIQLVLIISRFPSRTRKE